MALSLVHVVGLQLLLMSMSSSRPSKLYYVKAEKNELITENASIKCNLDKKHIELLKFVIPHSYGMSTESKSRQSGSECTDFAFFFMKRIASIDIARTYKIRSYVGGGMSGIVISLGNDDDISVSTILKIVLLDSSRVIKNASIPDEFSTSRVEMSYFIREYSTQRSLYEKYKIRKHSNFSTSKTLPFRIFDVFALSNYTITKKSIGKLDIAFYHGEMIPSAFSSKYFDWMSFSQGTWDLEVFLHVYFRSLISLYTEFGFIHGDIHFGKMFFLAFFSA